MPKSQLVFLDLVVRSLLHLLQPGCAQGGRAQCSSVSLILLGTWHAVKQGMLLSRAGCVACPAGPRPRQRGCACAQVRPCYEAFAALAPRMAQQALSGVSTARKDWLALMPPRQAAELASEPSGHCRRSASSFASGEDPATPGNLSPDS